VEGPAGQPYKATRMAFRPLSHYSIFDGRATPPFVIPTGA
jgi:hypothetical protein